MCISNSYILLVRVLSLAVVKVLVLSAQAVVVSMCEGGGIIEKVECYYILQNLLSFAG